MGTHLWSLKSNLQIMLRTIAKRFSSTLQASLESKLSTAFPNSTIAVNDTSGGCGSAFEISVISSQFKGLREVKKQRLVNKAIAEELKTIHSIRVTTKDA